MVRTSYGVRVNPQFEYGTVTKSFCTWRVSQIIGFRFCFESLLLMPRMFFPLKWYVILNREKTLINTAQARLDRKLLRQFQMQNFRLLRIRLTNSGPKAFETKQDHPTSMKPNQQRQTPQLPSPETWTHHPVFLRKATETTNSSSTAATNLGEYPIGVPFEFESELFKGKILFRLRDLMTSDDSHGDIEYFKGRKRFFQTIIQGRFKKEINVCDVKFGMESNQPLKLKPPSLMMRPIQALLKRTCPGIEMDLLSDTPKVISNFAGGVQTIRMDTPGLEPDILFSDIGEETQGFGGLFKDKQKSSAKRKKIFSNPKLATDYVFDTESVYTFDHYDDIVDLTNFKFKFSRTFHCNLEKISDQPFQAFAKTKSGEYLWNFELWHERLISTSPSQ